MHSNGLINLVSMVRSSQLFPMYQLAAIATQENTHKQKSNQQLTNQQMLLLI